jgi:hypothetical protein
MSTTEPAQEDTRARRVREEARAGILAHAIWSFKVAYGAEPRVSTQWAVAWGSENLNDGVGFVAEYDDEEDARGHLGKYKDGSVVRRTVIALQWERVPSRGPCGCGPDDRCSDCTPPDELAAAIGTAVRTIINDETEGENL